MLRKTVLRNDVNIIFEPMPKYDLNDLKEKRSRGRQPVEVHSTRLFVAAMTMVCHTMAHAP